MTQLRDLWTIRLVTLLFKELAECYKRIHRLEELNAQLARECDRRGA